MSDVLSELMGLNNTYTNTNVSNKADDNNNSLNRFFDQLMDKQPLKDKNNDEPYNIDYKDALINSLYSQLEFLREFLQQEIRHKNEIIKSLINTNTKQNSIIDTHNSTLREDIFNNKATEDLIILADDDENNVQHDHANEEKIDEAISKNIQQYEDQRCADERIDTLAPWAKHSSGFANRALQEMGYNGGGLGKSGNGIIDPVTVTKNSGRRGIGADARENITFENITNNSFATDTSETVPDTENVIAPWPAGTTCIIGDSMLNNLDEKKLGRNVKVRCYRGGVVDDMFDLANVVIRRKPTNLIIHVGTNNSISQNASTIANNVIRLKHYIETKLKSCTVIISSLIVRTDFQKANNTITYVNAMLKI